MKQAIQDGNVEPRSSLGVQFRDEHPKGTDHGDAYLKLKREETNNNQ